MKAIIGILLIRVMIISAQPIDDFAIIGTSPESEITEPQAASTENAESSPTYIVISTEESEESEVTEVTEVTEETNVTEETHVTEETEVTEETTDPPTSTTEELETTVEPIVVCDEGVAFLPAPECTDYYMCLHGVGILKSCPDGLYWDPRWSTCNWNSAGCNNELPEYQCEDGIDFLPMESDCTQYIQCVHNSPIQMTCPANLLWNQPLRRCDYECEI